MGIAIKSDFLTHVALRLSDKLVPEGLRESSAELFDNQQRASYLGAVLKTDVNKSTIYLRVLAFKQPTDCCYARTYPQSVEKSYCSPCNSYSPAA